MSKKFNVDIEIDGYSTATGHKIPAGIGDDILTGDGGKTSKAAIVAHAASDGSDHTFIDQSVIIGSSPVLVGENISGVNTTVGQGLNYFLGNNVITGDNFDLSPQPAGGGEVIVTQSGDVGDTPKFIERYISDALGGTKINGGAWVFRTYASVDADQGVSTIIIRLNKSVVKTGTVTTTGTGLQRTFIATEGSTFVAGDANASILLATLIETPTETFWIDGYVSGTEVTATSDNAGYVNEAGVPFSMYYLLFSVETEEINGSEATLYVNETIQPSFSIDPTDEILLAYFMNTTSSSTKTISLYKNGTEHYSHLETPLLIRHNDTDGLNEGDYQHLTPTELAIVQGISGVNTGDQDLSNYKTLSTGFISGLDLTINADPTKIDISSGVYIITDYTNPLSPVVTPVIYAGVTGITPSYLATANASYLALDINGTIIQSSSPFDSSDRRDYCTIGAAIHSNNTIVNVINEILAPVVGDTNQLHDLMKVIGSLNVDGNIYSPNGANLSLNKSGGKIFGLGINAHDMGSPHVLDTPEQIGLTFRYRLQDGTEYANTTAINPTQYDLAGVLTSVDNNKFTVQHIHLFQSNISRIQYGQKLYTTLNDAKAFAATDPFITEQNIADNSIFRAYLILKKEVTDLSVGIANGDAFFMLVDKFGSVIGGAASTLTLATLLSTLGFTPEDEANKQDSLATDGTGAKYPTVDTINAQFGNIDNTSDADKPVSTAQQTALDGKEDADGTILKDADIGVSIAAYDVTLETGATADQSDAEIKTAYENNANTNEYSDSEKSKLAGLESSHFKGLHISLAALDIAHPTASAGDYADVDTGVASDTERYIWDVNDSDWIVQAGASTALTDSQIKTQYENNANTNEFNDTEKSKLAGIATNANNYTHPSHPGDDFSVDSGPLSGATVISDIDINITTDTQGHVTDANGVVVTRNLTLANLGYTGETDATADQSNAEIRAAVEAATDSNVFTDADHIKLNSAESNAKDDQTSIVGITGTKAQFNTELSDGDFLYVGDAPAILSGTTIQRVAATSTPVGVSFWDTDLKIPCYLESAVWYNAAGGIIT